MTTAKKRVRRVQEIVTGLAKRNKLKDIRGSGAKSRRQRATMAKTIKVLRRRGGFRAEDLR